MSYKGNANLQYTGAGIAQWYSAGWSGVRILG